MADGTVSMAEGLGLKALDSIELRRKQQLQDSEKSSQISQSHLNPKSPILIELETPKIPQKGFSDPVSPLQFQTMQSVNPNSSSPSELGTSYVNNSGGSKPESSYRASSYGVHSPNSVKNPSPSRKLQQAFFEEGLVLEAEERARQQQQHEVVHRVGFLDGG